MGKQLRATVVLLFFFAILTGVVYPLLVTAIAQFLFPDKATGSLLTINEHTVGSGLIGQQFSDSLHFRGRPSATGQTPYDAASSSGSNLAPTNEILRDSIRGRVTQLRLSNPEAAQHVPIDLVTASGSGLDPHISVDGALFQVKRVSRATGLSVPTVIMLITEHTEDRFLGFLGEPRVNVLQLNMAVDRLLGQKRRQ